jgi:acylphosphatase
MVDRTRSMDSHRRIEVHYSGNVQGVGFRYHARTIAQQHDVAGFIRNLEDGRVQLVAEGEKDDLLAFLREIDQQMNRYIREKSVSWQKANGQFVGFVIRA